MLDNGKAFLDLGTNTFHIWIIELQEKKFKTLFSKKVPVKIGQGGISEGKINSEAEKRIFEAFQYFNDTFKKYQVVSNNVKIVATSAFRNAKNAQEIREKIKNEFNIDIEIIDGNREAELIYYGVREAVKMNEGKSLIMDIGGGSVEFIIANSKEIFWKESFEIGAQRLLDKFYLTDPISDKDILKEYEFLEEKLESLHKAVALHQPKKIIGASGTFDTLVEMEYHREQEGFKQLPQEKTCFTLSESSFLESYQEIISKNKEERLKIKGM